MGEGGRRSGEGLILLEKAAQPDEGKSNIVTMPLPA